MKMASKKALGTKSSNLNKVGALTLTTTKTGKQILEGTLNNTTIVGFYATYLNKKTNKESDAIDIVADKNKLARLFHSVAQSGKTEYFSGKLEDGTKILAFANKKDSNILELYTQKSDTAVKSSIKTKLDDAPF